MKKFNEKHEAIIDCYFTPTVKAKEGETVPHQTKVKNVSIFYPNYFNGQEYFVRVQLPKEMILELAAQIAVIENEIIDSEYSELPW
jgi:hypothetical protein